jgi:hypothetical protein
MTDTLENLARARDAARNTLRESLKDTRAQLAPEILVAELKHKAKDVQHSLTQNSVKQLAKHKTSAVALVLGVVLVGITKSLVTSHFKRKKETHHE